MKLGMVGIIVDDMEKAIKFYECIGFPIKARYGEDYVELEERGIRISLNTKKMIEGMYGFLPESSGDKIELAFELPTVEAVDELTKKVNNNNYEVIREPWDATWNQRYAVIKDPDGNLLSLFCNL